MALFGKKKDKRKKKKGFIREWVDALVFAVIAATLIRWFAVEAYKIPTGSMESTLLAGDFLFVSKLHYGPRTPKTPLQVPLTHQTIWGTKIPSYTDIIQLPQFRLWSLPVNREDVVVFNYPAEMQYPSDLKTNYIKRCVAIPDDELEIKDGQVFVNGKASNNPPNMQMTHVLIARESIKKRVFDKYDISEYQEVPMQNIRAYIPEMAARYHNHDNHDNHVTVYLMQGNTQKALQMAEDLNFIYEVKPFIAAKGIAESGIYPPKTNHSWSKDNYGKVKVPSKGMTIQIDSANVALYGTIIKNYEDNRKVNIQGHKMSIDGKPITEYTFQQNYYFMMGDNRHQSLDSRFWGFVPHDHIVGKAWFVWFSIDPKGKDGIRWSRILNFIK